MPAFAKAKTHQRYYVNGKRVPGVTTIAGMLEKPALKYWANRIGLDGYELDKYVDPLADIGTLAHKMVENYYREEPTDTSEYSAKVIKAAEWSCLSFLNWEQEHKIEPVALEVQLVSDEHRFGGTIDLIGREGESTVLIDFKSGKAVYEDNAVQVAGYHILATENGYDIDKVIILNIPRTESDSFDEWVLTDEQLEAATDVFLCLRTVYDRKKGVKR